MSQKIYINFLEKVSTWQEAIQQAAQPLLNNELINQNYIDTMIDNVINHGDYIILAPKVALPHARPEDGAYQTAVSILRLDQVITFASGQDVALLICLATKDSTDHLELLSKISLLIDSEEKINQLLSTPDQISFQNLMDDFMKEEDEI